ncbi:hypothetical protein [Anaeromyxobacter terrae]|uniref:hypothetical protein n=1 Tax=Anaeromyxobacter terrae TaxID=2925406 RepID=UPI001F59FD71|nr:hypothetical protein [Anaeromyxobacter sp. SG22]
MNVLVDFDNLVRDFRRHDLRWVAETVIHSAGPFVPGTRRSIRIRLYGGWYEQNKPTRLAQALMAEIDRDFPALVPVEQRSRRTAVVSAELAYSLEIEPQNHIFHTLRTRNNLGSLKGKNEFDCGQAGCPMKTLLGLVSKRKCTVPGCTTQLSEVLHRQEQKLVDSMMLTDLIHLSSQPESTICVVSSDDDLWPGIRFATLQGANVLHAVNPRKHSARYLASEPNYKRFACE